MVPWNLHVIPATINLAKSTMIVEEWHDKMPDDGRKQLKERQRRNKEERERYLRDRGVKRSSDGRFNHLFK